MNGAFNLAIRFDLILRKQISLSKLALEMSMVH